MTSYLTFKRFRAFHLQSLLWQFHGRRHPAVFNGVRHSHWPTCRRIGKRHRCRRHRHCHHQITSLSVKSCHVDFPSGAYEMHTAVSDATIDCLHRVQLLHQEPWLQYRQSVSPSLTPSQLRNNRRQSHRRQQQQQQLHPLHGEGPGTSSTFGAIQIRRNTPFRPLWQARLKATRFVWCMHRTVFPTAARNVAQAARFSSWVCEISGKIKIPQECAHSWRDINLRQNIAIYQWPQTSIKLPSYHSPSPTGQCKLYCAWCGLLLKLRPLNRMAAAEADKTAAQ